MARLKLTIDREAWNAGVAAGKAGRRLNACPYPAHSREAWSWQSGFVEGIARPARNLDSPKAEARQARAALVAVRTRLLKCAGELSKSMGERLKNCHDADVNKSMIDGLSIEEKKVIGPLLRSVAEINKQIGVYARIEGIAGDKP
jgi:hypothetical protein